MPNLKSAKKALRQNLKRYIQNKRLKERVKRWSKKFDSIVKEKNYDEAKKVLAYLQKLIDKAAKKNIFHKNKASRLVSRLYKKLNSIESLGTK